MQKDILQLNHYKLDLLIYTFNIYFIHFNVIFLQNVTKMFLKTLHAFKMFYKHDKYK